MADTFAVIPEKCIACDACCVEFPEVFTMEEEYAVARDDQSGGELNARTVVETCPTDAITYSGELPEPEEVGARPEIDGWQEAWETAARAGARDTMQERERRYGRDYHVETHDDRVLVTVQMPTVVPPVRDRFRFGITAKMPAYEVEMEARGQQLVVKAVMADEDVQLLTNGPAFPDRFQIVVDLPWHPEATSFRMDANGRIEAAAFQTEEARAGHTWIAHLITDDCTGCTICAKVCPTGAITGESKEMFFIDPETCINCSVCGIFCPFDAINDQHNVLVPKMKHKEIPKALVIDDLCTGCDFCVTVCPFDSITLEDTDVGFTPVARVNEKTCVSCKLCEQVCIKDAIYVPRDQEFSDIGWSFQEA